MEESSRETIKIRTLFVFWLASLLLMGCLTVFETVPGYMDADYYTATGMVLAQGGGFHEPFLWNYLADPTGLPQPSHAHWMPLASLLSALGMLITGQVRFAMARIPFVLIASLISPLTAILSVKVSGKSRYGVLAGLIGLFPGFYLPYLITTETFGLYAVLGTFFLLLAGDLFEDKPKAGWRQFGLGIIAGLMHLSRSDGILWLLAALGIAIVSGIHRHKKSEWRKIGLGVGITFVGYLVLMGVWYWRNLNVWGGLFPVGNNRMLFLNSYNELFTYPSEGLTLSHWMSAGIGAAVKARIDAFWLNLKTAVGVQGMIALLPMILWGGWRLRSDRRVQISCVLWVGTLALMTVVFPFAGSRGGFFHAGAAVQPMFFALVPVGFDALIEWGVRKRNWKTERAWRMFTPALVVLAAIFSLGLFYMRVIGSGPVAVWQKDAQVSGQINAELQRLNVSSNTIVMINNPPGFFVATKRPSIVIPDGGPSDALLAGRHFGASVLILELNHPDGWNAAYSQPDLTLDGYTLLSKQGGTMIYALNP